ncbi:Derepression protein [Xenorhabdus stockiae]|uniref:Derepression protein n=1 Tax=Xenorhabdus stockiae TaxID=351614 RepID=UPI003CE9A134
MKKHLSIESYHKLNRTIGLAKNVSLDLKNRQPEGIQKLYIPTLFSYISEDISGIFDELKN